MDWRRLFVCRRLRRYHRIPRGLDCRSFHAGGRDACRFPICAPTSFASQPREVSGPCARHRRCLFRLRLCRPELQATRRPGATRVAYDGRGHRLGGRSPVVAALCRPRAPRLDRDRAGRKQRFAAGGRSGDRSAGAACRDARRAVPADRCAGKLHEPAIFAKELSVQCDRLAPRGWRPEPAAGLLSHGG